MSLKPLPTLANRTQLSAAPSMHTPLDREFLVSWLFLIGSLIFTLDAVLENLRSVSFSSLLHISASLLFTIGSVLFIPSRPQK